MADAFVVTERRGLGLATLMKRAGDERPPIDFALPEGPYCLAQGDITVIGTGPGAWLAASEAPGSDWPEALQRQLEGRCWVCDQTGGYIVYRVSGAGAQALLQRGVAIDLHPQVFVAGSAATTSIAHIGVILWRVADTSAFDVAVARSYGTSFRHWIDAQHL